ncbi:FAD-dependent oxidoreductase [Streptomyces iconiensis]|uniref:FAD-dependent monooxygenase n=1 Tax=Streptomyces iconiensis TaxID=1384038 RepID=A0ABT6ZXY6_9ACTN|nr:FAD-dependent oxidoreductase [Streptomyces iconiensis]MDJ1133930.1 FAD-dependent monooxygenase [Streptomyces iconiensis]
MGAETERTGTEPSGKKRNDGVERAGGTEGTGRTGGTERIETEVCVVGGGPGGRALALALTQLGRGVVLLEKRDPARSAGPSFRGESVSPDGVRLLDGLGVLDHVREATHRVDRLEIQDAGHRVLRVRFEDFPYAYRHPVELAQPVLLSALAARTHALATRTHPHAQAEAARTQGAGESTAAGECTVLEPAVAVGLLTEGAAVTGVRATTPRGPVEIGAALTVGADGRNSAVRRLAGLDTHARRTPLERDVIWMKLPFPAAWDRRTYRVRIGRRGHGLFLPSTDGTVRVGLNVAKGGLRALRSGGLDHLRTRLAQLAPEAADAVHEGLSGWSDTTLLDIFTTEVPRWSAPGVVLIGDAAHTLSPILGQGINHALADAVALAPLVARALGPAGRDGGGGARTGTGGGAGRRSGHGGGPLSLALGDFQRQREGDVRRSRALQLRQERMFALTAPAAGVLRRSVYRTVNASPALQRRVLAPAYFPGRRPQPPRASRDGTRAGPTPADARPKEDEPT